MFLAVMEVTTAARQCETPVNHLGPAESKIPESLLVKEYAQQILSGGRCKIVLGKGTLIAYLRYGRVVGQLDDMFDFVDSDIDVWVYCGDRDA